MFSYSKMRMDKRIVTLKDFDMSKVIDSVLADIDPELGNLTYEQHCLIIFYEWHGFRISEVIKDIPWIYN